MVKNIACWVIIFGMAAACANPKVAVHSAMNTTLRCHLEIAQTTPVGVPVVLTQTLTNTTNHSIEVLQYHTPFEGILGDIFELKFGVDTLTYRGPMVKRLPPGDEDWLKVEAGDSLTAFVDIAKAWDLDQAGEYQLQLKKTISYRIDSGSEPVTLPTTVCKRVRFSML